MHFFGAQKCTTWHALARALESIDLRNHWPLQILPQIFHPKAHKSLIPQESRGAVESPGAERPTSGTHSKRAWNPLNKHTHGSWFLINYKSALRSRPLSLHSTKTHRPSPAPHFSPWEIGKCRGRGRWQTDHHDVCVIFGFLASLLTAWLDYHEMFPKMQSIVSLLW